jgi:hypothetical protein
LREELLEGGVSCRRVLVSVASTVGEAGLSLGDVRGEERVLCSLIA